MESALSPLQRDLSNPSLSRTAASLNPHLPAERYRGVSSYLDVIMGVPVRIKDDDSISSSQIDTQAPSPGRQKEAELLSPRS